MTNQMKCVHNIDDQHVTIETTLAYSKDTRPSKVEKSKYGSVGEFG